MLAFENLSSDPEMQYFSDGVSEEILLRLARDARLSVIGRTSSFQFRGDRKAEAASSLHCSHVVDGSIQRAGGRIRVSAQMAEAKSGTILWSERYDRELEDLFKVQDEISGRIASALDRALARTAPPPIDPDAYDLYLRARPNAYSPDELRRSVATIEDVTRRAPEFASAWGRLAYLRAWLNFYEPFATRPERAAMVSREAERALALDARNIDAMVAQLFVKPPFGNFMEAEPILERLREAPGTSDGSRYIGWLLRMTGRVREALDETERVYRLDSLGPMTANLVALARMAAGRTAEAVPVYEELVSRVPEMSFPLSSLLRAKAFLGDWEGVDRLLALATERQLREFEDGLVFIRAKRDPSKAHLDAFRRGFDEHVEKTGGVDVSRLVYAAHLGLVDEAFATAERARLGPSGASEDIMGPDGYRTSLLFQAGMPELRNDPRFPRLCARLGLVEFWIATGKWPDCAPEVPYDFEAACAEVRDIEADPFGP